MRVRHILVAAGLILTACSGTDATSPASSTTTTSGAEAPPVEFLFVQDAASAEIMSTDDGLTVVLNGVDANATYLSDRPHRLAGLMPAGDLVTAISGLEDPVNAALVWQDETDHILVIEIIDGEQDASTGTVTYHATLIPTHGSASTDRVPDGAVGPVSLFIDSMHGNTCRVNFKNETGGTLSFGNLRPAESELLVAAPGSVRAYDTDFHEWVTPGMGAMAVGDDKDVIITGDIPNDTWTGEYQVDGFAARGCSGSVEVVDGDGNVVSTAHFDDPLIGSNKFSHTCAEGYTCDSYQKDGSGTSPSPYEITITRK